MRKFPRADGSEADLTRYPLGERHEDFAVGVEAPGRAFGWTTVARNEERDLYLSLRNAARLPMTMLWFSNGGRDYAPWNGRHVHVLGVEEGMNRALLGHSAKQIPNALDAAGVPTGLTLDPTGTVEVRHVIGSIPWNGDGAIAEIESLGWRHFRPHCVWGGSSHSLRSALPPARLGRSGTLRTVPGTTGLLR